MSLKKESKIKKRSFRPRPKITPRAIVKNRIETVRHKGVYLLPNLFTLSSLFAGFFSVVVAMRAITRKPPLPFLFP